MNSDQFEFSLRSEVAKSLIFNALCLFFRTETQYVVNEDEYWDMDISVASHILGVNVYFSAEGYRTLVRVDCNFLVEGEELGNMAKYMAEVFQSESLVGDFRAHGIDMQDRFLVYFHDGKVAEAVDCSHDGICEVEVLKYI